MIPLRSIHQLLQGVYGPLKVWFEQCKLSYSANRNCMRWSTCTASLFLWKLCIFWCMSWFIKWNARALVGSTPIFCLQTSATVHSCVLNSKEHIMKSLWHAFHLLYCFLTTYGNISLFSVEVNDTYSPNKFFAPQQPSIENTSAVGVIYWSSGQ